MTVQEVEVTRPEENQVGHWFTGAGLCPVFLCPEL